MVHSYLQNYPQLAQASRQLHGLADDLSRAQGNLVDAVNLSQDNSSQTTDKLKAEWQDVRAELPNLTNRLHNLAQQLQGVANQWHNQYEAEVREEREQRERDERKKAAGGSGTSGYSGGGGSW